MEQIKGGMLEMLKYVAASQMNPAKAVDSSTNGESGPAATPRKT